MTLKISRSQVSTQPNPTHQNKKILTQPNPTQSNPWMDPAHDQLCAEQEGQLSQRGRVKLRVVVNLT